MSDYQPNPNQPYQQGPRPPEQSAGYGGEVPPPGGYPPPGQPSPPYAGQQPWPSQYPPPPGPPKRIVPWWAFVLGGCGCLALFVPILAAILFPVFSQARVAARASLCLSNEKQMATGVLMYCQDYDEVMPPSNEWMTVLLPYTNGARRSARSSIYNCPEVSLRNPEIYGYAYNSGLNRKPLEKITTPRATLMIYDSSVLSANATDSITSLPSPGRHRGRNQAAFADGHAARLVGAGVTEYNSSTSGSQ